MKYYRINKKNKIRHKREKMRNKKLIKKYPWLLPRNVWTDRFPDDYDYSYVEWYGWPDGWNKAFGDMFLEEFGNAVKEAGLEKTTRIWQMKEKYGQMRLYFNGGTEKMHRIVDKYSYLSENICCGCGKPDVPMINDGWYSPWCFNCFKKNYRHREKYITREDYVIKTETEIQDIYKKCICDDESRMTDSYTIRSFSKDGNQDETFDISETANKIREHWEKRKRKRNANTCSINEDVRC